MEGEILVCFVIVTCFIFKINYFIVD